MPDGHAQRADDYARLAGFAPDAASLIVATLRRLARLYPLRARDILLARDN